MTYTVHSQPHSVNCEAQACGCKDVHYGHGAGPDRACLYQAMFGYWVIFGHGHAQQLFGTTGTSIATSAIEAAGQDCSPLWFGLVKDKRLGRTV